MNLIEDTVVGIANALSNIDATVYRDEVKTEIKTPAFVIQLITHSHIRYPGNRFYKAMPFQVAYIPSSDVNCSAELYKVLTELNYQLEVVELPSGDLLRGKDISHEIINNVLYFYITYQTFERLEEEIALMDELEINLGVDKE